MNLLLSKQILCLAYDILKKEKSTQKANNHPFYLDKL